MHYSRRLIAIALASRQDASGVPLTDYEFEEYVRSLRMSADRTRWILYILIISVAVLYVATWNIRDSGWSEKHMLAWRKFQDQERALSRQAVQEKWMGPIVLPHDKLYGEPKIHEEYMKEYVRRMMLVQLPLVGVPIDVNDIGTFGGVWLGALPLLMSMSVAREHENLCLALYKVRKLNEAERRPDDGHVSL